MPYISVKSSKTITAAQEDRLQKEIGRAVAIIKGKNIDNTMTLIEGDCKMYMGGAPANATFCEIRLFGEAPTEEKREFVSELNRVITAEIGEIDTLYINIQQYFEWGMGGEYKAK